MTPDEIETEAILSDDDTMEAIAEALAELPNAVETMVEQLEGIGLTTDHATKAVDYTLRWVCDSAVATAESAVDLGLDPTALLATIKAIASEARDFFAGFKPEAETAEA